MSNKFDRQIQNAFYKSRKPLICKNIKTYFKPNFVVTVVDVSEWCSQSRTSCCFESGRVCTGNNRCVKNFDNGKPFEGALSDNTEDISSAFKWALAWDRISPISALLPYVISSHVMVQFRVQGIVSNVQTINFSRII
jgi:hypothetical protein